MPLKLKMPLKEAEFYCVSCRTKVKVNSGEICVKMIKNKKMPNGVIPALRGNCKDCGTNLTKWIKRSITDEMILKYGEC